MFKTPKDMHIETLQEIIEFQRKQLKEQSEFIFKLMDILTHMKEGK